MTTRRVCFTLNNPAQSLQEFIEKFFADESPRYIVCQLEKGETGTPHFQGYAEFSAPIRWGALATKYHMHCSSAKGTEGENTHYCSKPVPGCTCKHCVPPPDRLDGPLTLGSTASSGRGARSDLHAARDTLREHGIKRVAEDHLEVFVKYTKAFHELDVLERPPRPSVSVSLYFGAPGTGKTYSAERLVPSYWTTPPGWDGKSFWFDGLRRDTTALVIDEFRGQIPLDSLLKLLNPSPQQLPIKGGFTWLVSSMVIITSNIHPFYWYDWTGRAMQYAALCRRINCVVGFRGFTQIPITSLKPFFEWRRPVVLESGPDVVEQDEYACIPEILPNIFSVSDE